MLEIIQSDTFRKWLESLRTPRNRSRLQVRLERLALGNAGDAAPLGSGVYELQIDYGAGYLIYFKRVSPLFIVLLYAGNSEGQSSHVKQALRIAKGWPVPKAAKSGRKEIFTAYDAADYLANKEDMAAYLEAALEDGEDNAVLMARALCVLARAHGMVQLTEETGLSRDGLHKALSDQGNAGLGTILKVTKALGLKLVPHTT